MLKWLDLPPLWLVAFLLLARTQAKLAPMGLSFGMRWADALGVMLIGVATVLAIAAIIEFRRHRTTVIPHMQPSELVSSGVFARSRNPIYLADVLILTGFILIWDAVVSVMLIPVFAMLIQKRFILAEEMRLKQAFPEAFEEYCRATRRWI
ncbi:MAG: isoprenylcysteine carboxylmethyltransferase family protein [Pseudomonadota bacterium]